MPFSHDAEIPFVKMTGSGNDFVVIDHRAPLFDPEEIPEFARAVCRRGVEIGADGVVLIEDAGDHDGVDFRWRYVNADGSDGEMCGNGAMCGARYAVLHEIAESPTRFLTPDGVVTAVVDNPHKPAVRIGVSDPGPIRREVIEVEGDGSTSPVGRGSGGGLKLDLRALTMGVPHAVAIVDDAEAFADAGAFARIGRATRMHDAFAPAGTNLNVIHRIDDHTIRMRTYERGVEAETLACGTGAVASAVVAAAEGLVAGPPVTVITSSGRPLEVRWEIASGRPVHVWLGGEARVVATGHLDPEGWRA